jgi:hypothetical protein
MNLLPENRVASGAVKLVVADLADGEAVDATVDGRPAEDLECFAVDDLGGQFEINLRLPADLGPGSHQLEVRQGSRRFPPVTIDVV